ncbi:MAG: type IV pilus assembly protein PilM [Candidatus Nomurabacteria bacterium]|nr:type IV pilus assembly protein PilM [Candidatus Saccharibacteria bacterium]USN95760.1 MAG: type IV pilus assembly protein PilM [Candidatus Nomurabacteria bacterium]
MSLLTGVSDFFGLDIGTSAVRLVELRGGGPVKQLVRFGYVPIDAKLAMSDAKPDQQKVGEIIKDLLLQAKVVSKNVVVGIQSQRVFTTLVDVDRLSPSELGKSIKLQADSIIPTPVAESKIDWALIGDSPKDQSKVEVLLTSVPNEYIEGRLDLLESIGLNVIALEPDNLALGRALLPPDAVNPQMIVDVGENSSDIVVVANGAPRLTRSIPTGSNSIIKAAVQNLNIDEQQAKQFVSKFGLSKDRLEGQVFNAVITTVDILMAEIDKSIKFFTNRYQVGVEKIVIAGAGAIIPGMPAYVANKTGLNVEIGNAWRNVSVGTASESDLMALSPYFAVAAGLAERQE